MNIFVHDDNEQSNATGLPGNESNAVLHTSFSSTRSSSDNTSNEDSFSTQTSNQSNTQLNARPSALHGIEEHHLPLVPQEGSHQQLSHPVFQPTPVSPSISQPVRYETIQQPPQPSQVAWQFSQPHIQPYPTVHGQALGQFGRQHDSIGHSQSLPQSGHTLHPSISSSFNQQPIPQQTVAQLSREQSTRHQMNQDQRAQHQSTPPSAMKRPTTGQLRLKQQPVFSQSPTDQQLVPPIPTFKQSNQAPHAMNSIYKKRRAEEVADGQPHGKKHSPNKQSIQQQEAKLNKRTRNEQAQKDAQVTGNRGNEKKNVIMEKLVDYGPRESFESTRGIPDRLVHGGIIRPRPELSRGLQDEGKTICNGSGEHLMKETKTSHESDGSEKITINQHNLGQSTVGDRSHVAPHSKAVTGSNISYDCKGSKEETTKDEAALNAKARNILERDEESIKKNMILASKDYEPQPSAEDAVKARMGMKNEDIASELKIDINELKKNERKLDAAEKHRCSISEKDVAATGIELDEEALVRNIKDSLQKSVLILSKRPVDPTTSTLDFFERIGNYPEILMEIAKYLKPNDLVKLYSISKPFNGILSNFLAHTMQLTAKTQAPESASVFRFKFYGDLCVKDPSFRPHPRNPNEVRLVPSPRWLQMVVHRDKTIRDILALLARQGHRMQKGASLSLKKMWLLMDVATTRHRVQLLHSPYFTDKDIFNMQMFFIKLDMRFNNPYDGPGSDRLRKVMLGQRGLTPLRNLLKRKIGLTEIEVAKIGIRYAYHIDPKHRGMPIFDIPPEEIGIGHLEGWGKGSVHLYRPDELVLREGIRRRLNLKGHLMGMMIWGYINPRTGKNIEVTDEEKYMSESESEVDEYDAWNDEWETDSEETGTDDSIAAELAKLKDLQME